MLSGLTRSIGTLCALPRFLGDLSGSWRWKLDAGATRFGKADRNRLLCRSGSMFALTDVLHFLPHEFPGLCGRTFSCPRCLAGPLQSDQSERRHQAHVPGLGPYEKASSGAPLSSMNKRVRIAFMGNPGYGGLVLEALLQNNAQVVAVFHPSRRRLHHLRKVYRRYFRSRERVKEGVRRLAAKLRSLRDEQLPLQRFGKDVFNVAKIHSLRIFDGSFVRHRSCPEVLRALDVDVILVATFGEILSVSDVDVGRPAQRGHPEPESGERGSVAPQTAGLRLEAGARVGLLVQLLFVALVLLVKLGGDVSGFAIRRFHGCGACGAE